MPQSKGTRPPTPGGGDKATGASGEGCERSEASLQLMDAVQLRLTLRFLQLMLAALCPEALWGGTVVDTPEETAFGACLDLPSEEERSVLAEVADA